MTTGDDHLRSFRDAYLDYLEGNRTEPPRLQDLPPTERQRARAFVESITAARGLDPYASRPSVEQLLARRARTSDSTAGFGEVLQKHLRSTVDPKASVTADVASEAAGLASAWLVQARGMRLRVVPEWNSEDLPDAIESRTEDMARVFSEFPDSHAVLYTTTDAERLGTIVDRGDVHWAIEAPSGKRRAPCLRRPVIGATKACEEWLKGMIPDFQLPTTKSGDPSAGLDLAIDPLQLANEVVQEVSLAGARARIAAKRETWRDFGTEEADQLAAIVQRAQRGQLSRDVYESCLKKVTGRAA